MKKGEKFQLTMADIAREAGVSIYTVSAAMRGLARTSAKTRTHVIEVAERLGYSMNSPASLLARQRKLAKKTNILIATLGNSQSPTFVECCKSRGWMVKNYDFANGVDIKEVCNRMKIEGVDGIFVPGNSQQFLNWEGAERFEWHHFCVVKSSRALPHLSFDLVRHSAFDYQLKALDGVRAKGYRRIGVVLHQSASEWDDRARLAATLLFQRELHKSGGDCDCEILEESKTVRDSDYYKKLRAWVKEKNLDALVLFTWSFVVSLIEEYGDLPENPGLAAVMADDVWNSTYPRVSGCNSNIRSFYDCALDTLEKLIVTGKRGFVNQPKEHVIEPTWIDGDTLPGKTHGLCVSKVPSGSAGPRQ